MDILLTLRKKRTKRRIIEGLIALFSLIGTIVFSALKEKSMAVSTVEVTPYLSYDTYDMTRYTQGYTLCLLFAAVLLAASAALLLTDLRFAKIRQFEIDGESVIIYKGFGHFRLLVNGEERDSTFGKRYMETKLKSGTTMVASVQFFGSFHITLSDNRPPMEI